MALTARDSASRASQIAGITSETAALDFDLACSMRLLQFENKREHDRMKAFKYAVIEAVAELFGGKSSDTTGDDEIDDEDSA